MLATYSVHLQATLPNATLPCDELPFTREADVVAEGLALEKGHFTVPTGSRLGIKVDMGWWSGIASLEIVVPGEMG